MIVLWYKYNIILYILGIYNTLPEIYDNIIVKYLTFVAKYLRITLSSILYIRIYTYTIIYIMRVKF